MESHFDYELKQQKEHLQEELTNSIKENIDKWLEQIFFDVSESEKDAWIEEVKEGLEQKLKNSINFNDIYRKLNGNLNKNLIKKYE
ncbi:hypothetical protein VCRA2110O318_170001 [Vibrio crassostreae]|nr:hypothetical protein VCRA2117O328_180001 [Vibrio crassostreae]CAK2281133.1 hypothetical protein VCRA2110O318_170001 [Vibrio crassostreae]CAK2426525.1 hypothetical protein VCRA2110O319_180090 [Vibrio crassostreae]CAK2689073.1 hypothetical protein VCRA217O317_190001 [Vibrio crassostreae]